tara:strand:+ start:151 stop:354 length:204 start_codon:yes stop_codon:yes gene_type:complete
MIKPVYYKIKECRVCKNRKLKIIIDLNNQYIQGSFIKKNYLKNGGRLIFPLPTIQIITKKNYLKNVK